MRRPQFAVLALLVIACIQMLYFNHAIDKAIVAAHFNVPGDPNGWQTKQSFFSLYVLLLVLGLTLSFGLPFLFSRIPARYMNLPNSDFWLAPERRALTLRRMADEFAWLGAATVLLVLVEMQITLSANLSLNPHVEPLGVIVPLGCYLAFAVWWFVRFLQGFSRPR